MTSASDYRDEVTSDKDIERLLSGEIPSTPKLAELSELVEALRSYRTEFQSIDVEDLSNRAAALVISSKAPADDLEEHRAFIRPRQRGLVPTRRIAAGTAAFALLVSLSGTAVAANMSNPGDALYGLDRAMERVGIGNGHIQERTSEADALIAEGNPDEAFAFLAEYLEELTSQGNEESVEKVVRHIELAASKTNPKAQKAQERVAELKAFIELNKGSGVGLDGKDFGQGVSEIARGESNSKKLDSEKSNSRSENAVPKKDKADTPSSAGPKDK